MTTTADARAAVLLYEAIGRLEARLGRAWSDFDTLPPCPECGAPLARGRVGGVLCMGGGGILRKPHARRLAVWEKTIAPAESAS